MTRRLFDVFAGLSLTLSIAAAALWAHSYRADNSLSLGYASAERGIDPDAKAAWHCRQYDVSGEANRGRLVISYDVTGDWVNSNESQIPRGFRITGAIDLAQANPFTGHPWFEWSNTFDGSDAGGEIALEFPLPALFLLTAMLSAASIWGWDRKRSGIEPSCRVCGYDLRATPGRCPECGTEVKVERR